MFKFSVDSDAFEGSMLAFKIIATLNDEAATTNSDFEVTITVDEEDST